MDKARTVCDEIIDFLARGATSAEVVAFRPSEGTQELVRELLLRNTCGEITPEEARELERFGKLEHFMQLVKARARLYVDEVL